MIVQKVRMAAVVCVVAASPWLAGCGVIFGGTRQSLRATSSPDGTAVTTTNASVAGPDTITVALDTKPSGNTSAVGVVSSEPGVSVGVQAQ